MVPDGAPSAGAAMRPRAGVLKPPGSGGGVPDKKSGFSLGALCFTGGTIAGSTVGRRLALGN